VDGTNRHAGGTGPATGGARAGEDTLPDALASLSSLAENTVNLFLLIKQVKARLGVVPFVGAGMSVPFGFPAWRPFLESQAPDETVRQRIVELLDHGQYEEAAEVLLNARGENAFHAVLEHTFGAHRLPERLPAAAILQLPRLCSGPVLTTNFDPVLEKVFENARRPFEERILGMKVDALREAFHHSRCVLVKLHGDAADRTDRVLTWSDYERAYGEREPLTAFLRFAMMRPLLFLGCSLGNDRTVRVLEALAGELRGRRAEGLQVHYAIVEQPAQQAEFLARNRRLTDLGIRLIWYPTGQHGLIADLLVYLAGEAGRAPVYGAVPAEPPHYLLRSAELAELRAMLLAGNGGSVAITGQGHALGVQGMGGVGKTVLAAALTRDAAVQKAYPDGIFWLTVSAQPKLLNLLNELARWLPDCDSPLTSETEAQRKVREALAGKRALLILDDVWHVDHAAALNVTSAPGRLLVTTRKRDVLVSLDAKEVRVDVLTPEASLRMVADWAGQPDPAKVPAVATEVARECGCLPLALAMIGAMVRLRPTAWVDALELLRGRNLEEFRRVFPDYPYPDLLRAIAVGVDELPAEDRERYLDLAVFPEDRAIFEGPLQVLWELTPAKARACMDRLVARSLATLQEKDGHGALLLHDLQWDYVRKVREKKVPELHTRFLDGYRAKCPTGWASGPNDGYYFARLADHLVAAGRKDELRRLLLDFNWLHAKVAAGETVSLIAEYEHFGSDTELKVLGRAIRLSAYVVAHDVWQLPGQLVGRLSSKPQSHIQRLVEQCTRCASRPWLRPLAETLTPPDGPLVCTLIGHDAGLTGIALTPNGRGVVSASSDGRVNLWDLKSGELCAILSEKEKRASVLAMTVTPDGKLVCAIYGGVLKVWDLIDGRLCQSTKGHEDWGNAVTITPDGSRAVYQAEDLTLKVVDLTTALLCHTLKGHDNWVEHVVVTHDGSIAISASRDRTLRVWDLKSGRLRHTLEGHEGWVRGVAVPPDGSRAVSVSDDRTLRVWDLSTGQLCQTLKGHEGWVKAVAVTPDGSKAIVACDDGTLKVWDLRRGGLSDILIGHGGWVRAVVVTPDGSKVVSASDDQTVRVWELRHDRPWHTLNGHLGQAHTVEVTRDGSRAVSASDDGTLKVWDLRTFKPCLALTAHDDVIAAAALVPDGSRAISASRDQTLKVWDLTDGRLCHTLKGHEGWVNAVAVTPDGSRAISTSNDGTLKVWDLSTGQLCHTLKGHEGSVKAVAVTPDGCHAISASPDLTLRVWDLRSGQLCRVLTGDEEPVSAVTLTPSGSTIVSAASNGTLRIWDLKTGQLRRSVNAHDEMVTALAVTPDGSRVVSASCDGTLKVWDLGSGRLCHTLTGHWGSVLAVAVTRDGSRAISTCHGWTLKVWDLGNGQLTATFTADAAVLCCAAIEDGRTFVAGDELGRVHFLRLELPQ